MSSFGIAAAGSVTGFTVHPAQARGSCVRAPFSGRSTQWHPTDGSRHGQAGLALVSDPVMAVGVARVGCLLVAVPYCRAPRLWDGLSDVCEYSGGEQLG